MQGSQLGLIVSTIERFHCSADLGYKEMIGMVCMLLLDCVPRVYDMRKRSEVGTSLHFVNRLVCWAGLHLYTV